MPERDDETATVPKQTDYDGRASLGKLPSVVGTYTVTACFNSPAGSTVAPISPCTAIAIGDGTYEDSASQPITAHHIWPFTGFFAPVDNPPILNIANAGSAIPVKFSLGGNRGLSIFQPGYPKAVQIACSPTAALDLIEEISIASTSELKYDTANNRYQYNWKTTKTMAGKCWQLQLGLIDGNTLPVANFKFK